jgi:Tol biopolymer transport system component
VSDCRNPFWSADGTRVFYIRRAGEGESLYSVASIGGTPQLEIPNVTTAALSPSGNAIVFLREEVGPAGYFQALWDADPIRSEPRRFATGWIGNGVLGVGFLRFSPDGRSVALWGNPVNDTHPGSTFDNPEVWVFTYPAGDARRVLTSLGQMSRPHPFAWMPDNRRLVFGADLLGSSPGTHLWLGDTATDDLVPVLVSSSNSYEPDVSRDGQRIAFTTNASHYDLLELPVDGSAPRVRLATARDETDPAWSGKGAQYAYVTDRSGPQEIWLSSADGSLERPAVTPGTFQDGETYLLSRVAFAPDGQRLAYQRRNRDGYYIWVSNIDGGPAVQPIPRQVASYQDAPAWSPDGEWIAFIYGRSDGRWHLGKMRPGLIGDISTVREDVNFPASPAWSPNGRWISCEFEDGLYIVSPDGRERRRVSDRLWLRHAWALDSASIIAIRQNDDNRLALVSIDIATTAERLLNADLGPAPPATPPIRGFSLSADGRTVLTSLIRLRGDLHVLDGFSNARGLWRRLTQNLFMTSPRLEPGR